jgi:hypothetical protein
LPLSAGSEVVVWPSEMDALTVLDDGIGRRKVHIQQLANGRSLSSSEFSIPSSLMASDLIRSLRNNKDDLKAFKEIIKMAACTMLVTRNHGIYAPTRSLAKPGDKNL